MIKKINSKVRKIKQQYEAIFSDNVSDEFEKECQETFLKYVDYFYKVLLAGFAFMTIGSLYFFTTRVILQ